MFKPSNDGTTSINNHVRKVNLCKTTTSKTMSEPLNLAKEHSPNHVRTFKLTHNNLPIQCSNLQYVPKSTSKTIERHDIPSTSYDSGTGRPLLAHFQNHGNAWQCMLFRFWNRPHPRRLDITRGSAIFRNHALSHMSTCAEHVRRKCSIVSSQKKTQ